MIKLEDNKLTIFTLYRHCHGFIKIPEGSESIASMGKQIKVLNAKIEQLKKELHNNSFTMPIDEINNLIDEH